MLLQHETAFKLQQKSFTVVHLHMPFTLMVLLLLLLQRFLSLKEKMQVGVQLIELLFT